MGLSVIKNIIKILDKKQRIHLGIITLMIAIGSFLETLSVAIILPLITVMTEPESFGDNIIFSHMSINAREMTYERLLIILSLMIAFVYLFKNIFLLITYKVQYWYTFENGRKLSESLLEKYIRKDYLTLVEYNIAELQRNIMSDVDGFFSLLSSVLMILTEIITCGMLIIYLLMQNFVLTIAVIFILLLFSVIFIKKFKVKAKRLGEHNRSIATERIKWMRQAFEGIKDVKVSRTEMFFIHRYNAIMKEYSNTQRKNSFYNTMMRPIMEVILICGLMLLVCVEAMIGNELNIFLQTISSFAVASIRMLPSFSRISGSVNSIMYYMPCMESIVSEISEHSKLEYPKIEMGSHINHNKMKEGVKFSDVTFSYPADPEKKILNHVNFEIPKNKSVAFIGPSGAGKTTLIDILLGLLDVISGQLLVDGERFNKDKHQSMFGYIPQNIYLLDDSISANVAFGISKDQIDYNKVNEALNAAQLLDYVENLPDGVDTIVGERGVRMSGGQRQRLGIARALYYNPEILVLDEATSALDSDTEAAVMDSISYLSGKKTLVIVAHRLSTIKSCDYIFEIKNGNVIQKNKEDIFSEE